MLNKAINNSLSYNRTKFPISFNVFGEFQSFLLSLYFFLEWHNDTPLYTSVLISLFPDIILISFRICLAEFSSLTIALVFKKGNSEIYVTTSFTFQNPLYHAQKDRFSFSVTGGRSYSKTVDFFPDQALFDIWTLDGSLKVFVDRGNHSLHPRQNWEFLAKSAYRNNTHMDGLEGAELVFWFVWLLFF